MVASTTVPATEQTINQMLPLLQSPRPKVGSAKSPNPFCLKEQRSHPITAVSQPLNPFRASQPPAQSAIVGPLSTPIALSKPKPLDHARLSESCQTQHEIFWDASRRHPVFFTERFKRLPNGVCTGVSNPVAAGYVYEDAMGKRSETARL